MSTAKSVPANSSFTPSATRLFNSVLSATVPKSLPPAFHRRTEMFPNTCAMPPGRRKDEDSGMDRAGPTQAWTVSDGGIDLANRRDPLADEVKGFAQTARPAGGLPRVP